MWTEYTMSKVSSGSTKPFTVHIELNVIKTEMELHTGASVIH